MENKEKYKEKVITQDIKLLVEDADSSTEINMSKTTFTQSTRSNYNEISSTELMNGGDQPDSFKTIEMNIHVDQGPNINIRSNTATMEETTLKFVNGEEIIEVQPACQGDAKTSQGAGFTIKTAQQRDLTLVSESCSSIKKSSQVGNIRDFQQKELIKNDSSTSKLINQNGNLDIKPAQQKETSTNSSHTKLTNQKMNLDTKAVQQLELTNNGNRNPANQDQNLNKRTAQQRDSPTIRASSPTNTTNLRDLKTNIDHHGNDKSTEGSLSKLLNKDAILATPSQKETKTAGGDNSLAKIESNEESKSAKITEKEIKTSNVEKVKDRSTIPHDAPISKTVNEEKNSCINTVSKTSSDEKRTDSASPGIAQKLNGSNISKEELLNKIEATLNELNLPKGPDVYLKKERKLEDDFTVDVEVGRGRFGVVKKVIEKSSGREFAAKYIASTSQTIQETREEIEMMNYIHNQRLVYLQDAYETKASVILLLEYVPGGELFEKICEDDNLTEREACRYMQQVLEGVYYLHKQNIVHLDLKPENILCVPRPGGNDDIKLIDFGMAKFAKPGLKISCGTPEFVAPEVLCYEEVTLASDMWSIGVIAFVLLSGLSPFLGDSDTETIGNVSRGDWDSDFEDEDFESISEFGKNFIRELLVMEPSKRNDIKKCLTHDWILAYHGVPVDDEDSAVSEKQTSEAKKVPQLPERKLSIKHLKRFIARRRWQRTLKAVRAMTRLRLFGFMRSASQDNNNKTKDSPTPTDK